MLFNTNHATSVGPEAWQWMVVKPVHGDGRLLNTHQACIGRWSMDRWPLVDGRLWMLSTWRWVAVEPLHGCIERWSVERWSLIDARLLGEVRFLNLRRKPALV